nr:MAG TPA: hypothetical protein [Caudoviricetes sp.]
MAFLWLLDRVALMATGRPTTRAGMVAGPTLPARRPAIAPRTAMIEMVATQVIRVVAARLGSWAAVFNWGLLGGVGSYWFVALSLSRFGWEVKAWSGVAWHGCGSRCCSFVLLAVPASQGGLWS